MRILPARKALYSVQRRPQRRPSATHTAGPPDPAGRVTNPRPVRPNGPPRSLIDRGAFAVALILTPVSRETQEQRGGAPRRVPAPHTNCSHRPIVLTITPVETVPQPTLMIRMSSCTKVQ